MRAMRVLLTGYGINPWGWPPPPRGRLYPDQPLSLSDPDIIHPRTEITSFIVLYSRASDIRIGKFSLDSIGPTHHAPAIPISDMNPG